MTNSKTLRMILNALALTLATSQNAAHSKELSQKNFENKIKNKREDK